jgi:MYXO-CTERM domain-containing protein
VPDIVLVMVRRYPTLSPAVFLLLCGCAADLGPEPDPELAAQTAPIIGGIVDPGHAYVVGVGTSSGIQCTGTVISKRTVVTAGHCYSVSSRVFFGPTGNQSSITVATKVRHPGYNNNTLANDLTVLKLSSDAPVQPAPLLRETMANTPEFIGPKLTFVGYGLDDANDFGTRRVVTFPIDAVGPANVGGTPGTIDATQFYYKSGLKNTCNGDSGGPAFAIRGGVERHAGTTSFGDGPCQLDGVQARTDQPTIDGFIQAQIETFEAGSMCKNDGTCNDACNTGGQIVDPDCHELHCAADGICALACVAPVDPDCTGVNHCVVDGVCQPGCQPADQDCANLPGLPDAGPQQGTPDAALPPPPPDAAPPPPPDAAPVGGTPDAADPGAGGDDGDDGEDIEGGCGCRAGGASSGALPAALLLLALFAALAWRREKHLRRGARGLTVSPGRDLDPGTSDRGSPTDGK